MTWLITSIAYMLGNITYTGNIRSHRPVSMSFRSSEKCQNFGFDTCMHLYSHVSLNSARNLMHGYGCFSKNLRPAGTASELRHETWKTDEFMTQPNECLLFLLLTLGEVFRHQLQETHRNIYKDK
jgi:hypothetical protein